MDFSTVDEIAISLGFDGNDPCRLRAALTYELEHNAANGHVFLPREKLLCATSQLLAVTPDELEPVSYTHLKKIPYTAHSYDPDGPIDGVSVAQILGPQKHGFFLHFIEYHNF